MPTQISVSNVKMDDLLQALQEMQQAQPELEAKLKALHDADEMDELELMRLQELMQKQNQTFEMMSNMMKKYHDTTKTIISSMR